MNSLFRPSLLVAALFALPFLGSAQTATTTTTTTTSGPLAIYRLSFKTAGENINYQPYQNGYYIAPITGGVGSLILTKIIGGKREYFTYASFGELFVAMHGDNRKAVITCTAANSVSTTTFFAIGDTDDEREVTSAAATSTVFVATRLDGYAVSADSERDLPFASTGASDVGVAGASTLTARLDDTLTEDAMKQSRSLTGEVTEIQTRLKADGYVDGKALAAAAPLSP
jgi:hypothetical protein